MILKLVFLLYHTELSDWGMEWIEVIRSGVNWSVFVKDIVKFINSNQKADSDE